MATAATSSPPPSTNVLGALTFTLYVLSALVLTTYISISLLRTYNTISLSSVKHARIQLFTTLATISFATLSYHMLHFLINSYRAWALQQPHPITLPQGGNGLGEIVADAWSKVDVWQWLKDSTLFEDFAHEALGSRARSWWTVIALCASIHWAVSMSIDGKTHNVPGLWAYAAIAQILPVSFAQNLFYVAILLSAPSSPSAPSNSSENPPPSKKLSSSSGNPVASNAKLETICQTAPFLLYYVLVAFTPSVAISQKYGKLLLLLVGLIRILLIAPLFFSVTGTPDATASSRPITRTMTTTGSTILVGYQTLAALRANSWDVTSVLEAVGDNPAVAALGWDCLVSVGSAAAWLWTGGATETG